MKAALRRRYVSPSEGASPARPTRAWLKALGWLLCVAIGAGSPDLAWSQYSSGGYSPPGGGSTSGYSAPSRPAPVSRSGGGRRRGPFGGGAAPAFVVGRAGCP